MTGLRVLVLSILVVATSVRAADEPTGFAAEVDLRQLGRIAVHHDGRLKSFDSFASGTMRMVTGPHRIGGQSPTYTFLELMMRGDEYMTRDIIYIKKKPVRRDLARVMDQVPGMTDDRIARFTDTGLIAREVLVSPPVADVLADMSRDLRKTARYVQEVQTAITLSDPSWLLRSWRVVPPVSGDSGDPWPSVGELLQQSRDGALDPTHAPVVNDLRDLVNAWMTGEAAEATRAANRLAATLPAISPEVYPHRNRLAWESWYFHNHNLTWVWLIFALALVPLMLSLVFRWPAARWIGLGFFLLAFGFQTFALLLRWYVAQRWPNSNMFEAVTTAAWMGGCAALLIEIRVRRTPMRSLFLLVSAAASMVALMCAHYQPMYLDPNLSNRMPVLHDVWLYIHTNVIILSYCLIFMAAVSAGLYLLYRFVKRCRGAAGVDDYARVGGAGSLIQTTPDGATVITRAKTNLGQVLDGTTMVLMEMSFILLWAGLVMGAIWADHSWGRPWGWDPKEVFALNTFIVFAVLVHGRFKVKDKGAWTAVVALFGAGVMLFNWIAINFVITGLHSYA